MAEIVTPKTLQQAIRYFSDLDVCQQALVEARWPEGVTCPTCGGQNVAYLANQRRWQCRTKHPKRQFSAKVGTIFEDSPVGLDKWFTAMWLIGNAENGISSYEIHRAIGVTQKTAWFMLHRVRLAKQTGSFTKINGTTKLMKRTSVDGRASCTPTSADASECSAVAGSLAKWRHGVVGSPRQRRDQSGSH